MGWAGQNDVQKCPSLTKFLPTNNITIIVIISQKSIKILLLDQQYLTVRMPLFNDATIVSQALLKIFKISMFWNVGYFDRMGILAVSCFHRNLISLPLTDYSAQFVFVIPSKERRKQVTKLNK